VGIGANLDLKVTVPGLVMPLRVDNCFSHRLLQSRSGKSVLSWRH
jgi:hypothetical protein